jgi:hypothetical protein
MLELSQIDVLNARGLGAILLIVAAIALFIYAFGHSGKGAFFAFLLLAGAGTLGYFEYTYQSAQAQGQAAIEKVYNNAGLKLHCERFTESLTASAKTGERYVNDHPDSIWVPVADCSNFLSWVKSDRTTTTLDQASGIHAVAAIAAQHSGYTDPCVSISAMSQLAVALGASQPTAGALTNDYYTNVWSRTAGNPGCSIV